MISILGTTLDKAYSNRRWDKWRPSVAICSHEDLLIERYYLIYSEKYRALADLIKDDIGMVSPETEVILIDIEFKDPWDFEEVYSNLYNLSRNISFNTQKEEYYINITTGTHVAQICFFLLIEANYFPAKIIQASPSNRKGDIQKGKYSIIDLDLSKYDKIVTRFQEDREDDISFLKSGIETNNRDFNKLIEEIEKVAIQSKEPILLTGPTGAGKSHLAKRVYELKKSRHQVEGRFVEVNCATLRGDNAMATLFGHKKGAFTGAITDRIGLIKSSDKGVLFLDEIGELGVDEQAMLLRAIEEKRFLPMGSDLEISSNFQLITGTNRDLYKEVADGRFREDLLARIDLWSFRLPSLKERIEDLEPNIHYEIKKFIEKDNRNLSFNKESLELFLQFATSEDGKWRSNFRDLNGSITRMCTLSSTGRIGIETVKNEINKLKLRWKGGVDQPAESYIPQNLIDEIDSFEIPQLNNVIKVCRESKTISDAGRKLFNRSRLKKGRNNDADRLKKYLAKYGLEWSSIKKL